MIDAGVMTDLRKRARNCRENGDVDGEVAIWKHTAELDPSYLRGHDRAIGLLVMADRRADAISYLWTLAGRSPQDSYAWKRLAQLHNDIDDIDGEISVRAEFARHCGDDLPSRLRLARLLRERGRGEEAAPHLRELAEATPEAADGWIRLANLHAELGDADGEIAALSDLLRHCAPDHHPRLRLARLLCDRNRGDDAKEHLRALALGAHADPETWSKLCGLCDLIGDAETEIVALRRRLDVLGPHPPTSDRLIALLAEQGRHAEAVDHLRALAEADAQNPAIWRRLVAMLADHGDDEAEIEALNRQLALTSDDMQSRRRLVRLLKGAGRKPESATQLRILAEAAPEDPRGWSRLTRVLGEIGDSEAEIRAIHDQLAASGPDLAASERLVKLLLDGDRRDEAAAHLRAVAEAEPANPEGWRRLAKHHADLEDVEGEISALASMLETSSESWQARSRLARLLSESGRNAEAEVHLRILAQGGDGDDEATEALFKILAGSGRRVATFEEMAAVFEEFAEQAPNQAEIHLAYGKALAQRRLPEAETHLRRALEIEPDNSRALLELARWTTNSGDLAAGAEAFKQLLRSEPEDLQAILGLANVCERQGRVDEAFRLLSRAIQLEPDNAKARRARASFLGQLLSADAASAAEAKPDMVAQLRKQRAALRRHLSTVIGPSPRANRRPAVWPGRAQHFHDFPSLVRRYVLSGVERRALVGKDSKVATMGSCFAEHLAGRLQWRGIEAFYVPLAEDINSTYANERLMQWVCGAQGPDSEKLTNWYGDDRRLEIERRLRACDLFIFSLGVAPCFFDDDTGEFVLVKGTAPKGCHFRTTTVQENVQNLRHIVERLRSLNPNVQILLTVSPVSLGGTLEYASAVVADCVSKSVLRLTVEDMRAEDHDILYWPSFEIVRWLGSHLTDANPRAFGANDGDSRHVSVWLQDLVIGLFLEYHGDASMEPTEPAPAEPPDAPPDAPPAAAEPAPALASQ